MTPLETFRAVVKSKDRNIYSTAAHELRQWMMANDPHWPTYHFLGPESWTNDANGPIYYQGRYHLFYQFDPIVDGKRSARTWGHAVSDDLVHWEDWPVALWPDTPYDRAGVYSGNTFVMEDGTLGALYTGNVNGHQETYGILAHSRDHGLTWHKEMIMHNAQRPNMHSPVHWDAQIWHDGDTWYQLIGGSTDGPNRRGAAYLWTSPDLKAWTLRTNVAPTLHLGTYWELPYLIPLAGRYVFMVGHRNPYWIGSYDQARMRFTPDDLTPYQFDTGNYYAVNPNLVDDKGPVNKQGNTERQLLFAWVTGPPSPTSQTSATVPYWQGAIALPRVLTVRENRVWQEPIPELQCLRNTHQSFDNWDDARAALGTIKCDTLEIQATFMPVTDQTKRAASFGFRLRVSPDGQDFVRVFYDVAQAEFGVDGPILLRNQQESAEDHQGIRIERQASFLPPDAPVTFHIFLDRSIIEVFVNGNAYTARAFAPSTAQGIDLWVEGGQVTLSKLDIWEIKSIW